MPEEFTALEEEQLEIKSKKLYEIALGIIGEQVKKTRGGNISVYGHKITIWPIADMVNVYDPECLEEGLKLAKKFENYFNDKWKVRKKYDKELFKTKTLL